MTDDHAALRHVQATSDAGLDAACHGASKNEAERQMPLPSLAPNMPQHERRGSGPSSPGASHPSSTPHRQKPNPEAL